MMLQKKKQEGKDKDHHQQQVYTSSDMSSNPSLICQKLKSVAGRGIGMGAKNGKGFPLHTSRKDTCFCSFPLLQHPPPQPTFHTLLKRPSPLSSNANWPGAVIVGETFQIRLLALAWIHVLSD